MFVRFRSALLLAMAVSLCAMPASAQAPQPAKVAILNAQKAVADTTDIKKAQADLQAKFSPTQRQIDTLNSDLQSIQQELGRPGLAPDREAGLRGQGATKQRQLQRLSEDLQADLNAARQDILSRAGRQMTEVVRKLAEQRGFDVVIDITNTLYFKPSLDITADATAAYNQAYPAK